MIITEKDSFTVIMTLRLVNFHCFLFYILFIQKKKKKGWKTVQYLA